MFAASVSFGSNACSLGNLLSPFVSPDVLKVLKFQFGLTHFRAYQAEIINSALEGHDIFVVLPTGGGKSLLPITCMH